MARFTLNKCVDPYVAFRLESQFYDGSVKEKKLFFSPLLLTESAGIARKFYSTEEDFITSRLGFGLRQLIRSAVDIDLERPDVLETVDSTLVDGGLESVSDITLSLHKNMQYVGKLTLYRALFFSRSDEVKGTETEDDWKAIDVNWENMISATVTRIITVNLYTQLLYDREVSRKGRFKETLAIGVVLKML